MPQNPVFEIEFEETVAGFSINPVAPDATPRGELNEGAPADQPRSIIRNDQNWSVNLRWRTSGGTTTLLVTDWKLGVHLLSLNGGGAAILAGSSVVAHNPTDPFDYDETITIPAGSVPDGLYKLYVSVETEVPGAAKARINGFGEGPMISIYTPN
jgi:hypothetical protein